MEFEVIIVSGCLVVGENGLLIDMFSSSVQQWILVLRGISKASDQQWINQ